MKANAIFLPLSPHPIPVPSAGTKVFHSHLKNTVIKARKKATLSHREAPSPFHLCIVRNFGKAYGKRGHCEHHAH